MWYIIANPASARGAVQQRWPLIEALLQEMGFSYTIRFTERRGHATLLAEEAVLRGHRQILGIGGDGTNHEIVNGLFRQQQVPVTDIAYTMLPSGTGNDWARTYQIPTDPRRRLQRLLEGKTTLQDVGLVQYVQDDGQAAERYFANVAGLAYDGFIGKKIDSFKGVIYNKAQYLAMVARYLMAFRPEPLEVTFGDQRQRDAYYTVNVGLCRYSGGGMQLVPHAVPDDGLFALTLAGRLAKWEVLLQTPRFYNGKLLEHPKVQGFQTDALTVRHLNDTPSCLEADGEYLGVTPAVFRILPRALKVAL
jgi:diacylglycerol kinase (ATP)